MKKDRSDSTASEHAVLIHIPADDPRFDYESFGLDQVEDPIIVALEREGIGELDGNMIGGDEAIIYLYGRDADRVYDAIAPVLGCLALPHGTVVVKRYGGPGAKTVRVPLTG